MEVMKKSGVRPISFICDNCPINQGVYKLLGGPGRVVLDGIEVFLPYDFVHIMKNLRNNWITNKLQELPFVEDGIEYLDVRKIFKHFMKRTKKPTTTHKAYTYISIS